MATRRQVGLELVEKSPPALADPGHRETVARRSAGRTERFEMAIVYELPQRPAHGTLVVDESKNIRHGDVWAETFAVQLEHDLENFVALLEPIDRIAGMSDADQAPHVLERSRRGQTSSGCLGSKIRTTSVAVSSGTGEPADYTWASKPLWAR
jgi:hypothetical protein